MSGNNQVLELLLEHVMNVKSDVAWFLDFADVGEIYRVYPTIISMNELKFYLYGI
jgi:hypothetical protein